MIKVLEVSSDSNIGGAGKCIVTYLKEYNKEEFDVGVVLPYNSLLKPEIEALGVRVIEAAYLAEKSFDLRAVSGLKKIFKQENPDIVHTHASMSARIAAKLCGIKTVYTRHSVFPPSPKISKGIGKKINGAVNNGTADRIIAVADAARENLVATGVNERKIDVILNGVEPLKPFDEEKREAERQKLGIAPNEKVALMAARLNIVKGHKYFIEAAKILKDKNIPFKFLIAGTGETEGELKEMIKRYDLESFVYMLGFIQDVEPLMNVMDVQVNCSFGTEATSLALLEGMSIGKPAVVTDFGGNPGVIKDGVNGFLIPTHNEKALAEKLITLFTDDELYKKMTEECRRIYNEKFTAEVYADNIENIYRELANKQEKGRS